MEPQSLPGTSPGSESAAQGPQAVLRFDDPSYYVNRELSMLEFHSRVMQLARDGRIPLLERLRFLCISSAILDEFFEIRVGGLKEQAAFGLSRTGPDGLGPQQTGERIRERVLRLVKEQYRVLNEEILPALGEEGIVIYPRGDLDDRQREWMGEYFQREVRPVLTPVGLDPAHPFPRILNKSLNYLVQLDGKDAFGRKSRAAVIQAPRILPRLIPMPRELSDVPNGFVLLTAVIHHNIAELFPGMKVRGCHQFRVTRNSDLWIDEEEVQDLLLALKGELPRRHYGNAVRLEVSDTCPDDVADFLLDQFVLDPEELYRVDGPVNLNRLMALCDVVDRPRLKYPSFIPGLPRHLPEQGDLLDTLRSRDLLLHHPYQSFTPIVDLVSRAAEDPDVLAIKMTVYRIGASSPLAEALVRAAEAGKEVTAVVELRARFDEAANIELASRLQEAGAKVAYGIVGFKAHAKMLLIVRREGDSLRRYVHLGTGNYNVKTARSYTDFGLLTSNDDVAEDVHAVFQQLTGLGRIGRLKRLVQTPFGLHSQILQLIDGEIAEAQAGRPAHIKVKMNSLIETEVIRALYRASCAGVKVDLVVRGICCLVPGIPGVSENIRVRSVVGRFLEHHRVFHFHAAGDDVTLCSSADWMPRNFFRRVEVAFPLGGRKNRNRVIREGIDACFDDNLHAWDMQPDGTYRRCEPGPDEPPVSSQDRLLEEMAQRSL